MLPKRQLLQALKRVLVVDGYRSLAREAGGSPEHLTTLSADMSRGLLNQAAPSLQDIWPRVWA